MCSYTSSCSLAPSPASREDLGPARIPQNSGAAQLGTCSVSPEGDGDAVQQMLPKVALLRVVGRDQQRPAPVSAQAGQGAARLCLAGSTMRGGTQTRWQAVQLHAEHMQARAQRWPMPGPFSPQLA